MYSSISSKIKSVKQKRVGARKFLVEIANGEKDERIDRSATRLRLLLASIKGLSPGFHNGL
jgi:hypothetical protein